MDLSLHCLQRNIHGEELGAGIRPVPMVGQQSKVGRSRQKKPQRRRFIADGKNYVKSKFNAVRNR